MSVLTVKPGATVVFDPSDKRLVKFDFDTNNLATAITLTSHTVTITAIKQNGATALTYDNNTIVDGSRNVQVRLLATTATLGDKYQVSVKGITSESPSQEKEYLIYVLVQNH